MNLTAPIPLIQQHIQAGRMAEAESLCRAALAQNPKQPEVLFLLAQIAETAQRPDAALDLINKALAAQSPPSATAYFARARILQILRRDEPALADYMRVIELVPQHADAWVNRGIILNRHGQKEQAIASYEAAIRVAPQASGAYYNLGNTYQEMGKKERAVSCFQTALAHLPSGREEKWRATIHEKLATLFSEALEYTRAGEQFRMAIALNPQSAELLKNYGNVLRNQGKKIEAFACYDAALAINPDYAEARWCKAMAHIPLLGNEPQNRVSLWEEIDREFDALDTWFNPQRSADGHKTVGLSNPFISLIKIAAAATC